MIVFATLGLAIAFSLPVVSQEIRITLSVPTPLGQPSYWRQANEHAESRSLTENISKQPPLMDLPDLTPEMITFFERRTHEHIERVRRNLAALASLPGYPPVILARGEIHDESKFVQPERVPYIWLTEFHRRRQKGEAFTYPDGVEAAIRHHVTTNRHHPEFHGSPNDMSDVDLIEMVCDWTAIAQELGDNEGSARQWADRTIGKREHFNFNEARRQFIYRVIDDLDRQLIEGGEH